MKQKHVLIAMAMFAAAILTTPSCGLLGGISNTNNTPAPKQAPVQLDYAPHSESVRGCYFTVKTQTQNLTVYFESRYSVDPQRTFINGAKTLAEYEYKEKNVAIIKYGPSRKQTITLHFQNDKGGKATYGDNETGTFTFVKYL